MQYCGAGLSKYPNSQNCRVWKMVCEALLFLCLCASTGNEATSKHILVMCLQWCYAVIIGVWLSNLECKNSYIMGFAESIYTTVAISFDGYSTDLLKGKRPTCYSQCTCTCPLASPYACTPVCISRALECPCLIANCIITTFDYVIKTLLVYAVQCINLWFTNLKHYLY